MLLYENQLEDRAVWLSHKRGLQHLLYRVRHGPMLHNNEVLRYRSCFLIQQVLECAQFSNRRFEVMLESFSSSF